MKVHIRVEWIHDHPDEPVVLWSATRNSFFHARLLREIRLVSGTDKASAPDWGKLRTGDGLAHQVPQALIELGDIDPEVRKKAYWKARQSRRSPRNAVRGRVLRDQAAAGDA